MKTKWELSDGVARSLMESLLRDEGEVIKQSPAKSVTRHEIEGESFYVKRAPHPGFTVRPRDASPHPGAAEYSTCRAAARGGGIGVQYG
ncbi:MAG: hypothetical protein VYE14_05660 [Verrucomicrobiota bacterium]|nr:hypothetical protein [Verrucomicrobiota bacterium]